MAEIDLDEVEFAEWLEEAIPALCRMPVKCIGMVALLKEGGVATNYWNAGTDQIAAMGYRMMEDGILSTLRQNGRELKEIIDQAGQDEDDGDPE